METVIYLLLCLPRRLGGYALPKPVLNPSIKISKAGRQYTIRRSAKPDLYWKEKRLDLEYNSDEFHDEFNRSFDSMRRKALEHMHVEVVELTKMEVLSEDLFHATAQRLARSFKKQLRPVSEGNFVAKRRQLRELLLSDCHNTSDHREHLNRDHSQGVAEDDLPYSESYSEPYDDYLPPEDLDALQEMQEAPDEGWWDDDIDGIVMDDAAWDDSLFVFGRGDREKPPKPDLSSGQWRQQQSDCNRFG